MTQTAELPEGSAEEQLSAGNSQTADLKIVEEPKPSEPVPSPEGDFFDFEYIRACGRFYRGKSDREIYDLLTGPEWEQIGELTGGLPKPNRFFDPAVYLVLNPDVMGRNPIEHYLKFGFAEGRPCSPLLDLGYLTRQCSVDCGSISMFTRLARLMSRQTISGHILIDPDFIAAQRPHIDPKAAYVAVLDGTLDATVSPHPLFNCLYYASRFGRKFATVAEALTHFIAAANRVVPIYLFDRKYYGEQVKVAEGVDPYLHFVAVYRQERALTHPAMDVRYYWEQLRERELVCDVHPLAHFVTTGQGAGCSLVRSFDREFYADQTGERELPFDHYFIEGFRRFSPNPAIDLDFVALNNPEFRLGESEVLDWFYSQVPGKRPSTHGRFDPAAYLEIHSDVRDRNHCPVQHFLEWGLFEGRRPSRLFSYDYVRRALDKMLVGRSAVHAYFRSGLWKRPRLVFASHDATLTGAPAIILRLLEDFASTGRFECYTLFDAAGARMPQFSELSHTYVLQNSGRRFGVDGREPEAEVVSQIVSLAPNLPIAAFVNSAESRHIGRALKRSGIPTITLLHEVASFYPAETFSEIYGWSDRVVLPSQYVLKEAERLSADRGGKVVVRGQGLLKDSFGQLDRELVRPAVIESLDLPRDAVLAISCGTMDLRKGLDYFMAVARELLARPADGPPVYFVWIGDGAREVNSPYYFAIEEARLFGLEDRVRFIGPRSNVEPYFVAADAFLMTARADPFPCVVHEAMACGLPIIGFEHAGGAVELYGELGRTVPYGDVRAMADALRAILGNEAERRRMAGTGREYILQRWRSQDYFQFLLAELDRLLEGNLKDEIEPRPFRTPTVVVLREGVLEASGELLREVHAGIAGAGLKARLLRTSFATEQDERFSQTAPDFEEESFANLVSGSERSLGDLIRQMDAEGGGVLVLPANLLAELPESELTPRVALAALTTSPERELGALSARAGALQLVLAPDAGSVALIERAVPSLEGKCRVIHPTIRREEARFSGRVLISALDGKLDVLKLVRRATPLVAAAGARVDVAILSPDRDLHRMEMAAERSFAIAEFEIVPIAGGIDLEAALRPGDLFLSLTDEDALPVGVLTALRKGAFPVVLGRLRWLRGVLNSAGVGYAYEAGDIEKARRVIARFVAGEAARPSPGPCASDYADALSLLIEGCGEGRVQRALRSGYLR